MPPEGAKGDEDPKDKEGEGSQNDLDPKELLLKLNELQGTVKDLTQTNARLLNQSKDSKQKLVDLKDEKDQKEKDDLLGAGKIEELLKKQEQITADKEKRLNEKEDELKTTRDLLMEEKLRNEIHLYAKDAHSVKKILRDEDFLKTVSYDNDSSEFSNVKDAVETVRKNSPYLFDSKAVTRMADGQPDKTVVKKENYMEELKQATTQKELNAVRKKYGRD